MRTRPRVSSHPAAPQFVAALQQQFVQVQGFAGHYQNLPRHSHRNRRCYGERAENTEPPLRHTTPSQFGHCQSGNNWKLQVLISVVLLHTLSVQLYSCYHASIVYEIHLSRGSPSLQYHHTPSHTREATTAASTSDGTGISNPFFEYYIHPPLHPHPQQLGSWFWRLLETSDLCGAATYSCDS